MSGERLPSGWNLSAIFRKGTGTRYTMRPAANRAAARAAWDHFAETGPVEWVQLLDGYWGCWRPGGDSVEEIQAIQFRPAQAKEGPTE